MAFGGVHSQRLAIENRRVQSKNQLANKVLAAIALYSLQNKSIVENSMIIHH